jgi:beta-glucosidase
MKKYLDLNLSVEDRTQSLLSTMTIEEKISQLGSTLVSPLMLNGKFSSEKAEQVLRNGIGQISAPAMTSRLPSRELGILMNDIQRYL